MRIIDFFKKDKETKEYSSTSSIRQQYFQIEYDPIAVIENAVNGNPYFSAALNKVLLSVSNISWQVSINGKLYDESIYLDLLSTTSSFSDLLKSITFDLYIYGNAYVYVIRNKGNNPYSLVYIPNEKMRVELDYSEGIVRYYIDNEEVKAEDVIHIKNTDTKEVEGSPIVLPVLTSVDLNNAARLWNANLMNNSAVPSGIINIERKDGGTILEKDRAKIQEMIANEFSGVNNSGKVAVLSNAKWNTINHSPKDTEFINTIKLTAREIVEGLGVSSVLIGDEYNKTYNNYTEAKISLYTETAIPLANQIINVFNSVLFPNDNIFYVLNTEEIPVLKAARLDNIDKVKDLTFMTENEKRELIGLPNVKGLDVYRIGSGYIDVPEGTQITEEVDL